LKVTIKSILAATAAVGVGLSLIHPTGAVKKQASTEPLLVGANVDSGVLRVLERSCQDCHSERTHWPWYSYVAPIEWFIEADVNEGRQHMNLSRWRSYSTEQQIEILTRIGAKVRSEQMPLPRYLQLHPEARLSEADIDRLYTWAHAERTRLKNIDKDNANLSR
jgi:hypothetical protein